MSKQAAATILVVDDEEMIRASLIDILEDEGYRVAGAENADAARTEYQTRQPELVLLDIWMPDSDGISLLREWQGQKQLRGAVVMMSGHGTIETAVEATKLGAYDFLEKPLSTAKLLLTVERALQTQKLIAQNAELKARIDPPVEIIGHSAEMTALREQASALAAQQMPVLLTGAAGSGKQHLANFIHQHSGQRNASFIRANLAAMESGEIMTALIGNRRRPGLIAQAENGTLYIDEIIALPADCQRLLIGLIENHRYLPGNDSAQRTIEVRLLLASRLPPALLEERLDPALFDQITVATLALPPLEAHSADVPELLEYFSKYFADCEQMTYRHFTLAAQNALRQHSWPGNIREVRNLVQRLLLQSDAAEISAEEAEKALTPNTREMQDGLWSQIIPKDLSLREARDLFEYQYLLEQFRHCNGNIARLAGRVGMDRTNLYRKLRSLGIDPTEKPQ